MTDTKPARSAAGGETATPDTATPATATFTVGQLVSATGQFTTEQLRYGFVVAADPLAVIWLGAGPGAEVDPDTVTAVG